MLDGSFNPESQASVLAAQGAAYHQVGNQDAARLHYDAALLLEPDHPIALQNLTGILFSSFQIAAALSVANRAVAVAPDNPYARANRAAALMHAGHYKRARKEAEGVINVIRDDPGQWHNYALILYMMGHVDGAIEAIGQSLRLAPENLTREADRGIFTLAAGDLQAGLAAYEVRWHSLHKSRAWDLGISEWKGEDLKGKRLLLHHEQGFGDGIMLIRFLPFLKAQGAQVTVAAPKTLLRLFQSTYGAEGFVDWGENYPADFDFHTPMLSVPRWLGTTQKSICPDPYLSAPSASGNFGPPGRLRVGICWASGDHSPLLRTRRRVVPLDLLFPLSELPGVRLVSLQKGEDQKDILNLGAESFVFDPMSKVEDFFDTAQVIQNLDLVISVDSAVAHLAGALGKPTLVLGPYTRCWRWWGRTNGLPWYRDMKIFPQESPQDWTAAVKRVIGAVAEWRAP